VGVLADCDARPRTLSFFRGDAGGGQMRRLEGCVVAGFPEGVHIAATVVGQGSSARLSFPVDPVSSRVEEVDLARRAAMAARLTAAKEHSPTKSRGSISPRKNLF
jgi:hypothetical protein